jgi:hypothetical protein
VQSNSKTQVAWPAHRNVHLRHDSSDKVTKAPIHHFLLPDINTEVMTTMTFEELLDKQAFQQTIVTTTGSLWQIVYCFVMIDCIFFGALYGGTKLVNILWHVRFADSMHPIEACVWTVLYAVIILSALLSSAQILCLFWSKGLSVFLEFIELKIALAYSVILFAYMSLCLVPKEMIKSWLIIYAVLIVITLFAHNVVWRIPNKVKAVVAGLGSIGILIETFISVIGQKKAYAQLVMMVMPFISAASLTWLANILKTDFVYLWRVLPHQEELRQSLDVSEDIWYGPLWKKKHRSKDNN